MAFVSLFLGVQIVCSPPLRAQAENAGQVAELYRDGLAAFNAGDYRRAAEGMRAVLAKAPEGPALEGVYYTLGAALYNLPDYPGAIDTLNKFRAKYPRGARFTDATYALAQAHLATKNPGEAIKLLATLEAVPTLRERALLLEADALREEHKVDDAVAALRRLVGPDPRSPLAVQGALLLITSLTEKGDVAGAAATLTQLANRPGLVHNAVQLNGVATDLGDRLARDHQFPAALTAYRLARTRETVLDHQRRRVATATRAIQANREAIRANPAQSAELRAQGTDLAADKPPRRPNWRRPRSCPRATTPRCSCAWRAASGKRPAPGRPSSSTGTSWTTCRRTLPPRRPSVSRPVTG